MAEFFAFGGEIAGRMGTARNFRAHAFDNVYPGSEYGADFLRIVGHQAHGPHLEENQDLNGKAIITKVYGVAQV